MNTFSQQARKIMVSVNYNFRKALCQEQDFSEKKRLKGETT